MSPYPGVVNLDSATFWYVLLSGYGSTIYRCSSVSLNFVRADRPLPSASCRQHQVYGHIVRLTVHDYLGTLLGARELNHHGPYRSPHQLVPTVSTYIVSNTLRVVQLRIKCMEYLLWILPRPGVYMWFLAWDEEPSISRSELKLTFVESSYIRHVGVVVN